MLISSLCYKLLQVKNTLGQSTIMDWYIYSKSLKSINILKTLYPYGDQKLLVTITYSHPSGTQNHLVAHPYGNQKFQSHLISTIFWMVTESTIIFQKIWKLPLTLMRIKESPYSWEESQYKDYRLCGSNHPKSRKPTYAWDLFLKEWKSMLLIFYNNCDS